MSDPGFSSGLLLPDKRAQYRHEAIVAILNAHSLANIEDEAFIQVVMAAIELYSLASKHIMMGQLQESLSAGLMNNDEAGHANVAKTMQQMMARADAKRSRLWDLNSLVMEALLAPSPRN